MDLNDRIKRDARNAATVRGRRQGTTPFEGMLEAVVQSKYDDRGILWYAHRDIRAAETYYESEGKFTVVPWTHPAFQVGRTAPLGKWKDFAKANYAIKGVKPVARAQFSQLIPDVAGLYEPGGRIGSEVRPKPASGLKAVKLEMTADQVDAFINRMNGLLVVTGAPGTGKTTIAFQRIRFLFDQQELDEDRAVDYAPALTQVFLASSNLIDHSRNLLSSELQIPAEVVSYVPQFIATYVDQVWASRNNARPITRAMTPEVRRGREALLNLCTARDLEGMWVTFEKQAQARFKESSKAEWLLLAAKRGEEHAQDAKRLAAALRGVLSRSTREPRGSSVRCDAIWPHVRTSYVKCRSGLKERDRERFDRAFANWLYWVFDPLATLREYINTHRAEALARIRQGTLRRISAEDLLKEILEDWRENRYFETELSWIAWMLRFALPEEASVEDGFRGIPRSIPEVDHRTARRWSHVVIDEAQDLAVQEASLLASFVHPRGALTLSADFKQVVSPIHGMTNGEAVKFGLPIWDENLHTQYSFAKNLRQSREIGRFLASFYQATFKEFAPFEPGDRVEEHLPELLVGSRVRQAHTVASMMRVFERSQSVQQVALLLIDEDERALDGWRQELRGLGVNVADADKVLDPGKLVVSSVERAKGLEFDACIVCGLEDVERSSQNFAKNRAYVALSRPTKRLFMLCKTDPVLLSGVQSDLYGRRQLPA